MKKTVFLNGKFVGEDKAKISALEPGLWRGLGLFETMRAYNQRIVYFGAHLDRLRNSCNLMKLRLKFSSAGLKQIIGQLVKINSLSDARVRLTLWKAESGTGILATAKKYRPYTADKYNKGFRAGIFSLRQNENYFFTRLKVINRLFYEVAYLEAQKKKLDEALILNNRGFIAEASRSNIFFLKNNCIFTPALECGCLDGVTRKVIFDLAGGNNIEVQEGSFTLPDLYNADEAFLTNALAGVMPLTYVEKERVGRGFAGKTTKFFMKKYNELLTRG